METIVAIVNPAAGNGQGPAVWRMVARLLQEQGIPVATEFTQVAGDGTALAVRSRADGNTTLVAVGGDGTVHEVVNGLLDGPVIDPRIRLGVVPAGTGMDFARNVGIDRHARAAARRIIAGRERRIDVGYVPAVHRVFVNFMETGLGASVVAREARLSNAWPGRVSFMLAAVGAAMTERNLPVRVSADGTGIYEGSAVSVVVANGRFFGGGMKIAPVASMDDGYLDVLVLGDFRRLELVRQIWKIYPGVHLAHKKVLHVRARRVSIDAPGSALLDLDGELGGSPSGTITVLPAALRVLV